MYCDEPQATTEPCEERINSLLKLRYLGKSAIEVRGTTTRNRYLFSESQPTQMVDERDAKYLLATTLFGIVQ